MMFRPRRIPTSPVLRDRAIAAIVAAAALLSACADDEPLAAPEPFLATLQEAQGAFREGDYEAAAEGFAVSLTQAEASGSIDGRLASLDGLGAAHAVRGQLAEAERFFAQLLALQEERLAADSLSAQVLARTLGQLGEIRLNRGRLAAADSCFQRILQLDTLGVVDLRPEEPLLAYTLDGVAAVLDARGRAEAADSLRQRSHGLKLYAQGFSYYLRDDLEQAEKAWRSALQQQARAVGESHLDMARTATWLGRLYELRGQPADARRQYELADGIHDRAGGAPAAHADLLDDLADLIAATGGDVTDVRRRAADLRAASSAGRTP